jgi:serine protease Do
MKEFIARLFIGTFLWVVPIHAAEPTNPPAEQELFVNLAEKMVPSVVNISTSFALKNGRQFSTPEDFFRRFFGDDFGGFRFPGPSPEIPEGGRVQALGTGFIIDSSGIILTNNHVVANADEINIQFTEEANEKPVKAKVIGRDPELDIALIQAKPTAKLVAVELGDSDRIRVGQYVMAIGNPFGQGHSASHGIISAKGRSIPEFPMANYLQTDAPINPGNSGGPLITLDGKVIGVNTAIQADAHGIGFAIPINLVKNILPQLRAGGVVRRGYLGVLIEPLTPEIAEQIKAPKDLQAPFVTQVEADGPAARAGLKTYDVITEVGGKVIRSPAELISEITAVKPEGKIELKIIREGRTRNVSLKLGQRPNAETQETPSESVIPSKGIGLELQNLSPEIAQQMGLPRNAFGVLVVSVTYGSPAQKAGLIFGDIIVEINQKSVRSAEKLIRQLKNGKVFLLRVRRPQLGPNAYSVLTLNLKANE